MRRDWLQATTDAIRRGHGNMLAGVAAGLGAAIAIGVMEWLSVAPHYPPLVIIPFATSIALVIGSPEAEPAQPRARCC